MGPCAFPLHWTCDMACPPPVLVDTALGCCRGCFSKALCYLGTLQPQVQEAKVMMSKAGLLVWRCKACWGRRMAPEM